MGFGFGRRRKESQAPENDVPGPLADMATTAGVDWAPVSEKTAGPKPAQPYEVRQRAVQTRLKDRNTAAVDMRVVVDAPHDVMWELLADPNKHAAIFDAIESSHAVLLEEAGPVRRWQLDYRARWKFWKVGGVCENRLWLTTDREQGTVTFELREPGFLRTYEGTWTITGPSGAGPAGTHPPQTSSCRTTCKGSSSSCGGAASDCGSPSLTASRGPSASSSPSTQPSSSHPSAASLASLTLPLSRRSAGSAAADGSGSGASSPSSSPLVPAATANPFSAAQSSWQQRFSGGAPAGGGRPTGQSWPTTIHIAKLMSPKVQPPYPLNHILKGHAVGQVQDMLDGLLYATALAVGDIPEDAAALDKGAAAALVGGGAAGRKRK